MKKSTLHILLGLLTAAYSLTSCEDAINIKTETGPTELVVDGWITNKPGPQTVRLTLSAAYFDNSPARPALGAEVTVIDDKGTVYAFTDANGKGIYTWAPKSDTVALGRVGGKYALQIRYDGEEYAATNEIKRVPKIDSLAYEEESFPINPPEGPKDGYLAQFYARDFVGLNDTYWIRPLKGGKPYGTDPGNISLVYDASFSPGSPSDGLVFIQPLRQSINVNQLFSAGDTVGVELHSITLESYYFLFQVRQETTNGGIFAVPPANIPTNISNKNANGKKALGFFGASAVSRAETVIDPKKARPKE
ncbi:DUF4249 domain-containing protein [Persicitalea jodogahamensis]|uniref:DUF4249 domain-containing protein n=1 Tax=Persicitalea jodogahamensis TaxID=402147 RepID=A0A8J3G786_9BACT|nr:DUF4249 domain-containing protein [Persicitalea jodogahamensis]GHB53828.1 hypothetical protein GCM10007390_03410 [Persicitalea jodogahamensis]